MVDYVNRGVYTYSEASRLLNFSSARIRGLLNGYKNSKPVLNKNTIICDEKEYLSFLDLIEIKFIKYFLEIGIKRSEIIKAYKKARKELSMEHPFATKFTTDGVYIFADNNYQLLGLSANQYAFRDFFELYDGIDFKNELVSSWKPYPKDLKNVILDPEIRYGQPVIVGYNILTRTLYDIYIAENKNINNVKKWYNLPENLIMEAIKFEERLN